MVEKRTGEKSEGNVIGRRRMLRLTAYAAPLVATYALPRVSQAKSDNHNGKKPKKPKK